MRALLRAQIYEIWDPEGQEVHGYRWSLKGKRVEIYSPKIFSSVISAEKDQQQFIHDNLSNVTIIYAKDVKERSDLDFIV